MDERDQGQRGYDNWLEPAQELLKRGILALVLDYDPDGLTTDQLKRQMTGDVKDTKHDQSVDYALRDLIADGLLEERAGLIKATQAARAFDQLGL